MSSYDGKNRFLAFKTQQGIADNEDFWDQLLEVDNNIAQMFYHLLFVEKQSNPKHKRTKNNFYKHPQYQIHKIQRK